MASHREAIEAELQRCMVELKNMKPRDAELSKLEAEIFGKAGITKLGAYGNSDARTVSLYPYGANKQSVLSAVRNFRGCHEGEFFFESSSFSKGDRDFELIIHSTRDKKGNVKVCSVCIFEDVHGQKDFFAYLFSTNDPLAFDNFNRFRGTGANAMGHCVEQKAFCEGKAKLNKHLVNQLPAEEFKEQAVRSKFHAVWIQVFNTPAATTKEEQTAQALAELKSTDAEDVKTKYLQWVDSKLRLSSVLDPGDYKGVGRNLVDVSLRGRKFLAYWDDLSLVCVLFARMAALKKNPTEALLAGTIMARCVAECSPDDNLWGYPLNPKGTPFNSCKRLSDIIDTDSGKELLFQIADDAVKTQDKFIERLKGLDDRGVLEMLTNMQSEHLEDLKTSVSFPNYDSTVHRLGLSEQILQALWRKELVFSEDIRAQLFQFMRSHGLEASYDPDADYTFYIPPNLVVADDLNAYDVVGGIGQKC